MTIITHLFYMDDLKTYAKSDEDQKGLLKLIVKGLSDDIRMEFGLAEEKGKQEGENLFAHRYVYPHRKEHLLENFGKTLEIQRS